MDLGELIPIVAILSTAWVMVTAMHYRGGKWRRARDAETANADDDAARLQRENEDLKRVIGRLEQRLGVLERIATDPAERTAREIERLRD